MIKKVCIMYRGEKKNTLFFFLCVLPVMMRTGFDFLGGSPSPKTVTATVDQDSKEYQSHKEEES